MTTPRLIRVLVRIPVEIVIQEYGSPYRVIEIDGSALTLVYPEAGISFLTHNRVEPGMVSLVDLGNDEIVQLYFLNVDGLVAKIMEDCPLIDSVCLVATATPTPSH